MNASRSPWNAGSPASDHDAYELRVGRWSRRIAERFVAWLDPPSGARWLDVGAGTGALAAAIAARTRSRSIVALDPAFGDLAFGRSRDAIGGAGLVAADARALPLRLASFDVVVSGAALNFLTEPVLALRDLARLVAPGGVVAAFVWDFGGEMQPHRRFWDAAIALDPGAARFDQATKFPLCRPGALEAALVAAGLRDVVAAPIDAEAVYEGFDDLWLPFVSGTGSVVDYARSLAPQRLAALRERVRGAVAAGADGRIRLGVRAFAARGVAGHHGAAR